MFEIAVLPAWFKAAVNDSFDALNHENSEKFGFHIRKPFVYQKAILETDKKPDHRLKTPITFYFYSQQVSLIFH